MPNWCFNRLDVSGESSEVSRFFEENTTDDEVLSFALSVPPNEMIFSSSSWLPWAQQNWGTKWDIAADDCDYSRDRNDNGGETISWVFTTAWAPPSPWLDAVAKKYPTLEFILWYDEPGMNFSGGEHYSKGKIDTSLSWYSEVSYMMANCTLDACDSEVESQMAEERQPTLGKEEYRPYCSEHVLYQVVEQHTRAEQKLKG